MNGEETHSNRRSPSGSSRRWEPCTKDTSRSVCAILIFRRRISLLTSITQVRRSLAENDLTVLSIFVNPAQFAPHEDLATYPRTLPHDLELLSAVSVSGRTAAAVFVPTVDEMYPSGISQSVEEQKGTFVEVKGYSHQMEGKTRPTFFRGVATVVTKLLNVVQVRDIPQIYPSGVW